MNEYIKKAEKYLENCVYDGLAHSWDTETSVYVKPYPEVTGYVIKYFCDYKKNLPNNIINAADYLIDIQEKKTGGFFSFDRKDILYGFDTSQIMIGLCAMFDRTGDSKYKKAAIRAGEFILNSQNGNGSFKPIFNCNIDAWVIRDETYSMWNGPYSGLMCKLTEGLMCLYQCTKEHRYLEALNRAGIFYKNVPYIEYSHPLGYWLEGLYAANQKDVISEVIEKKILNRIADNGYISYTSRLPYAYVSGTIQLGISLYKMGYIEEAKLIRNYGRLVQSNSETGGLFQYADKNGCINKDVHCEINSWGTKYFCELERLLYND